MTFGYRYRKVIFCSLVVVVLVLSSFGYFYFVRRPKNNSKNKEKNVLLVEKSKSKKVEKVSKEDDTDEYLKVDIKGEIKNPGIYSLKVGSRVDDVIREAGGLLDNADTTVINLSKKIKDEMVIIVYSKSQVEDFSRTREIENKVVSSCISSVDGSIKNDACIDSDSDSSDGMTLAKVSINTASVEEFMSLSGIGEGKAQKIVKYREENGPFLSIEDLKKVDGIGDSIYDKIKENLTL